MVKWLALFQPLEQYLISGLFQIGTEDDLIHLWNRFQADAKDQLYAATGKNIPVVLWTSRLTEKVKQNLLSMLSFWLFITIHWDHLPPLRG